MPKISALPPYTNPQPDDEIPIVDDSATTTKRLTLTSLLNWLLGGGKVPVYRGATYFTANGTYTKPSGMKDNGFVVVEVQAGGGGGGGRSGTASGGSGSAGSYTRGKILATELSDDETVTVGAAGSAGTSSPTAGGNGGNSSFGSHLVCGGGQGGPASSAGAPPAESTVITPGEFSVVGQVGSGRSSTNLYLLAGGSSYLSAGGLAHAAGNHDAYGFGGGGAAGGAGQAAGGAGSKGIVIVHEYY